MKFNMSYGLKIGCLCFIFITGCSGFLIYPKEQAKPSTFDLPVYGLYHNNIPTGNTGRNDVYWDNLTKAFKQHPQEIIHGIEISRQKLNIEESHRNQNNHHVILDPRFGAIPVTQQHPQHIIDATPVVLYERVKEYRSRNQRFKVLIPNRGYLVQQRHPGGHGDHVNCNPEIAPLLSFDDGGEAIDPCTGKSKNKAEFGLTATSGMADVLCMFCQHIRNLQCVWKFCSHPEGVYKIKVNDSKN